MALELDVESQPGAALGRDRLGRRRGLRAIEGGLQQRVVARRHSRRDSEVRRLLLAADLIAVCLGLLVGTLLVSYNPGELMWGALTLPLWVVIFKAYGLYDRDIKRISHGTIDDLPWIFHAMLLGTLLLLGFYRLTPIGSIELMDLATFAIVATLAMALLRVFARRLGASLLGPERVLLIGDGQQVETLARKLGSHPEYGV
ncbi:MAG TPA: hypothetical protein VFI03_05765, partial [Solirubrobacterales bacterium]|nr:hypothetical protein [Solirubrobacterales bacterium]